MMDRTAFKRLRVGERIRDVWYGSGIVIRKTARSAYIMLNGKEAVRYDREHVNHFIKKGKEQ
jgi:hypothetical protein